MDGLMGKYLAGWSSPTAQRPSGNRTGMAPFQGAILGRVSFNILISNIDSRIKGTLRPFTDDPKLSGVET